MLMSKDYILLRPTHCIKEKMLFWISVYPLDLHLSFFFTADIVQRYNITKSLVYTKHDNHNLVITAYAWS